MSEHICEGRIQGTWHSYSCSKKAKYFEDGKWYCGTHAPSRIKLRAEKKAAKQLAEKEALERDPANIARELRRAKEQLVDAKEKIAYWQEKQDNLSQGEADD